MHLALPRTLQNSMLLVASYVFYGFWDPRFLSLIAFSTLTDYGVGLGLGRAHTPRVRRLLLGTSLAVNLGLLGVFKYYDFFRDGFEELAASVGLHIPALDLILPVGISFYTFQTLSYSIDVYRRRIEPERSLIDFATFVAFFPQLVAGPIERASHLLPQLKRRRMASEAALRAGGRLVVWGFVKKLVIADNLARIADAGYTSGASGAAVLLGTYAFAFQIYCDFSGYTDIARGCARLFGIELSRNFVLPYLATGIRDFWQRWHISLSTWFREYLYIPLGGSRVAPWRHLANVMITFLISGLWHGADLRFLIWGGLHGLYYLPSVLRREAGAPPTRGPVTNLLRGVVTFHAVLLAWVFFRAHSAGDALMRIQRVFTGFAPPDQALPPLSSLLEVAVLGSGLLIIEWASRSREEPLGVGTADSWARRLVLALALTVILVLGSFDAVPFVYFQF